MTDLTEYFRSYIETLPYRFFCMVQMYIRQLMGEKPDQQKKNSGRRRSLIRRISNWIPVMPRKKIYIKVNSSIESSNSSNSSDPHRTLTQIKASDGLNGIRTIFDTTSNSGICWRSAVGVIQRKNVRIMNRQEKMTNLQPKEFSLQSESYNCTFVVPGPRASTPLSFLDSAGLSSNTDCAMAKITQLEEELALLRQQIASIAAMQGNSNIQSQPNNSALPQSSLPLPPPPPPPPPPLPPPLRPLSVGSLMPLKDGIQKSKLKKTTHVKVEEETDIATQSRESFLPHMSDVLKGIHKVKLRPIERSPGGTPLRRPALPSASQDPVSLLTAALQRRFARIHPQEISPEKENRQSFDSPSSMENGNSFSIKSKPFGQHLLKPAKKDLKPLGQNQSVI